MNSADLYSKLNYLKKELEKISVIQSNFRLGALILDKYGRIVSVGFNSYYKSHPVMAKLRYDCYKIYLHAEIDACLKGRLIDKSFRFQSTDYIMIIARLNHQGQLRLAKPCPGCYQTIKDKFKMIYYTNNQEKLELLEG